MSTEYTTTAVAFGDLKNAALYFDHLIPVYLTLELIRGAEWDVLLREVGRAELLPPELMRKPGFAERLVRVNEATHLVFLKLGIHKFGFEPRIPALSGEEFDAIEDSAVSSYFSFVEDYELADIPLAGGEAGNASMLDASKSVPSPVLTLMDLNVVDASRATWEQISEFRRDGEAKRRLRRLRLFAYENYSGRSRAFVEDDILTRIADYERAVKKWGFETTNGMIGTILRSKLSLAAVGGSVLSTVFGYPSEALYTLAAGAAVTLGHVAMQLTKQRFAFQELTRDNPVSYITYSQKKLPG
jgi:hypothetical protein